MKEPHKLIEKFGAIEEGNREIFNQIRSTVFQEHVEWQENIGADKDVFPFQATVNSSSWKLRINNFPDEPMYTLFVDGKAALTFDDMPDTWSIVGDSHALTAG